MSEKLYINILKYGVFASFLTLFFFFSSLLFPFISSKQLSFNILIEILLFISILFLIKYPKYLPKKSHLSLGIVAYFITILLSLTVSVDFNLSFWGDIERMLGFFHLLHFLFFYFIIITVFRSKKDYYQLLNVLVVSSVLVALYGIFKKDPNSTIGNRAYVAAMMLFAMFLQALFLLKSKKWWLKFLYIIGIIITLIIFIKSDISGAQLALVVGIFATIFSLVLVSKNKKTKIITSSVLIGFILIIVFLFTFRSSSIFDNNYLGRALRDFSSKNSTLNTRLISYQAAGKYLVDHPINMIFGVGHGNYALIFDRYFNPKFYNYDRVATYFDRAHNNLIDITTTTGILGLLSYLSIFLFLFIYLFRAYKNNLNSSSDKKIDKIELSIIFGIIIAYFVQNLTVFDSFATYLYFMVILAFVNYIGIKIPERNEENKNREKELENKTKLILQRLVLPVAIVLIIFSLINNINSFIMIKKTVDAYIYSRNKGIIEGSKLYADVFEYKTGLERDSREAFISLILGASDQLFTADFSESKNTILLAVKSAEKNENYNIYDNLTLTKLSKIYELAGRLYFSNNDSQNGSYYSSLALDALNRAIESSPGRLSLYLSRANLFLNFNQRDDAIKDMEYAKKLNPNVPDSYCQLAHFYFIIEDSDKFIENFKVCGELKGFSLMNWGNFIDSVEKYYSEKNDLNFLVNFYNIILNFQNKDIAILSKLALKYYELGDMDMAQKTALKILEIDNTHKEEVDSFIEKIKTNSP